MTALVADTHASEPFAALRVARVPIPKPASGEVLVRVHAAPCNPADIYYLEGRYPIVRPLPATPGFEGAGVVVASGGGMLGRWLVGKRVACGGHAGTGTWAEYCALPATQCLPLGALTFEQGAAALANPTTALALVELVVRGRHRAYVQTAAAGQLGRMILAAARERGLEGIHIVRRAAQVEALDARHVLVSSEPDFERRLAELAAALGGTIAFDAIAGEMTGTLVNALPPRSEIVVYGALSGAACAGIDPMALAFGDKKLSGFELAAHVEHLGLARAYRLARAAKARVSRGDFKTTIARSVPLAEAPAELARYAKQMSEGKVLLVPQK